jgi:hypothetical protein
MKVVPAAKGGTRSAAAGAAPGGQADRPVAAAAPAKRSPSAKAAPTRPSAKVAANRPASKL